MLLHTRSFAASCTAPGATRSRRVVVRAALNKERQQHQPQVSHRAFAAAARAANRRSNASLAISRPVLQAIIASRVAPTMLAALVAMSGSLGAVDAVFPSAARADAEEVRACAAWLLLECIKWKAGLEALPPPLPHHILTTRPNADDEPLSEAPGRDGEEEGAAARGVSVTHGTAGGKGGACGSSKRPSSDCRTRRVLTQCSLHVRAAPPCVHTDARRPLPGQLAPRRPRQRPRAQLSRQLQSRQHQRQQHPVSEAGSSKQTAGAF
jgi:hypothetical protein